MKFLCVPCDSPMKLQTVGPPDRGSLSVVYSCPECGYEIAMLTNAYETQLVQSLGVRIGPDKSAAVPGRAEAAAERALVATDSRPISGSDTAGKAACPFSAMIPATDDARPVGANEMMPVRWTAAAEARLLNVPEFVRPMARTGIERFARERGAMEVNEQILDAAKEFFGM